MDTAASQPGLPVGRWTIEFTNGVVQMCETRADGTARVVEPLRTAGGRVAFHGSSLVIVFEDDRTERWSPAGKRFVVEHWFPGSQLPAVTPVLGIAEPVRLDNRLVDRDGDRLREQGPAVVKMFVATLRQRFSDEAAAELRRFIDPRYLQEHRLQAGALPMRRVVTKTIYDNQDSDDPGTILIVAETEEVAKEAFLFRTTLYEGNVYILPLAPPDPTTGSFQPWILRMKL